MDETVPWDGPVDRIGLFRDIYSTPRSVMWMSDSVRMTVRFFGARSPHVQTFLSESFHTFELRVPTRNCGKSLARSPSRRACFQPSDRLRM